MRIYAFGERVSRRGNRVLLVQIGFNLIKLEIFLEIEHESFVDTVCLYCIVLTFLNLESNLRERQLCMQGQARGQ